MNFLYAFLVAGMLCAIGQIILDNTKLTPGHITSLFTVLGSILSFFGIYQKLIDISGSGATVIISNFGHLLYQGAIEGYQDIGFLGIFTNFLEKSSAALVAAVVFAFLVSLFFKPKH